MYGFELLIEVLANWKSCSYSISLPASRLVVTFNEIIPVVHIEMLSSVAINFEYKLLDIIVFMEACTAHALSYIRIKISCNLKS